MPTYKSPAIDNLITSITGVSRQDAENVKICVWCKKSLTPFRNQISEREHQISGMCQSCQDDTFGED